MGGASTPVELRKGDQVLLAVGREATFGEVGVIEGSTLMKSLAARIRELDAPQ